MTPLASPAVGNDVTEGQGAGQGRALGFGQGLLSAPAAGGRQLAVARPELPRSSRASHAGLPCFVAGVPVVRQWISAEGQPLPPARWPWDEQPELLRQVRQSSAAVSARTASGGNFLLAACGPHEGGGWL